MRYHTRLKLIKKMLNRYQTRQLRKVCIIKERMGYHTPELSTLVRCGFLIDAETGYITNFEEWAKMVTMAHKDALAIEKERWTSKTYI